MASSKRGKRGERGKRARRPRRASSSTGSDKSGLERLREICLAFPDAHEVPAWGEPTFRVKNKIFAMYASAGTHHSPDRPSVWILSANMEQDLALRARPDRYFKPPYVGPSGWIGAWLDRKPPWREIAELLRDGYERRKGK
jgi:predicted DNA-binding protein (MmcQ/YjbR family)